MRRLRRLSQRDPDITKQGLNDDIVCLKSGKIYTKELGGESKQLILFDTQKNVGVCAQNTHSRGNGDQISQMHSTGKHF